MSKSVLIIDTPKACIDCPCHFSDDTKAWCGKDGIEIETEDIQSFKPLWCPLKEIPKKVDEIIYLTYKRDGALVCGGEQKNEYVLGWNACIDEILKENEENE